MEGSVGREGVWERERVGGRVREGVCGRKCGGGSVWEEV